MILGSAVFPKVSPMGTHNRPIQWSDDRQLSINSGAYINILDGQLPLLVSLVMSRDYAGNDRLLDLRQMFSPMEVVKRETFEEDEVPLGRFRNFIVSSGKQKFEFSSFNELGVACHCWTPAHPKTKQCDLAVVFLTGEMLIFSRNTLTVDGYAVKTDVFEFLCDRYHVDYDYKEDIFYGDELQNQSMKVKAVQANRVGHEVHLMLLLGSGELLLLRYNVDGSLEFITSAEVGKSGLKLYWLDTNEDSFLSLQKVAVVGADNSVLITDVGDDSIGEFTEVIPPQVGFHHVLKWLGSILIDAHQKQLYVVEQGVTYNQRLDSYWSISGLVATNHGTSIEIIVGYDNGVFELWQWDAQSKQFSTVNVHKELTIFVTKLLELFQMTNSTAEDTEDVEETNSKAQKLSEGSTTKSEMMRKYLDRKAEGRFVCQGFDSHDGVVTIVYQVVPKLALTYTIALDTEAAVAFLKLHDSVLVEDSTVAMTTIARLNLMWCKQFDDLPGAFPTLDGKRFGRQALQFLQLVERFLDTHMLAAEDANLEVRISVLPGGLIDEYTNNPIVQALQKLAMTSTMVIDALKIMSGDDEWVGVHLDGVMLLDYASKLSKAALVNIGTIEKLLRAHLALLVLAALTETPTNDWDKYLVVNYYNVLKHLQFDCLSYENVVPQDASIVITSEHYNQEFSISKGDTWTLELVVLVLGQKFAACQLTGFPILELNNRKDELLRYNYKMRLLDEYGPVLMALTLAIDYSFLDGNRAFYYTPVK